MRSTHWFAATAATVVAAASFLLPVLPATVVTATQRVRAAGRSLPQLLPAHEAAGWLAAQLLPAGYVPTAPGSGKPNLSATAQTILALSAADVDLAGAHAALTYMEGHVDAYAKSAGADDPGHLALLLLDAISLGANPAHFGGTDLIGRLLATQQHSGPDSGLFGTESQVQQYYAGGYQQGLALAALAAAGVRGTADVRAAVTWLVREECPDGGWTTPANSVNPCNGSPAQFKGPDTNSTAVAAEGLAAEGAATRAIVTHVLSFYRAAQVPDGGWSYLPNSRAVQQSTDPDSTALVLQALLALHSPLSAWRTGTGDPVSALLGFQLKSGSAKGAFYFPPAPSPASVIATYQAIPALAGLDFPFRPSGLGYWEAGESGTVLTTGSARYEGSAATFHLHGGIVGIAITPDGGGYWLASLDGGVFAFGDARYYGSAATFHLHAPIVGIAVTPDGGGYWLVSGDGGVFAFGDARYHGSPVGSHHVEGIVAIATTGDGGGYWLASVDGRVLTFGDATYHGAGSGGMGPYSGFAASADGAGYWLLSSSGAVQNFGDAGSFPRTGGSPPVGYAAGIVTGRT